MPAKGETYNAVGIRLDKWVADKMQKLRYNQEQMARMLNINRGRISDMLHGKLNTKKYVDIVVQRAEGGNSDALIPYMDPEQELKFRIVELGILTQKAFDRSLTGEEVGKRITVLIKRFAVLLIAKRFDELEEAFRCIELLDCGITEDFKNFIESGGKGMKTDEN
jgi:predicted XRE-type DNA-binding protein